MVTVGDIVQSTCSLVDTAADGREVMVALPGAVGHVVALYPGACPTVYWERTGRTFDTDSDEMTVLGAFSTGREMR